MKSRLTVIFLSIISISFSQINFIQDNNITVVKKRSRISESMDWRHELLSIFKN